VAPSVPASVGPVATTKTYKIKAGDSLAKIANKFGISVQDILDANPEISNPNNIFVGQVIVIPVAAPT
jgi:LysM repeat protein